MNGFVIAGTHSGSGKTTVTLGIMAHLRSRGLKVQGFKVGPDFIDPGHHEQICMVPSHNLDTWMLKPWCNKAIYETHSKSSNISIIEGVMGLYDGFSSIEDTGSTAQLAKVLEVPTILVINASSMARSVAAIAKGFKEFDPDLNIIGIILNKVGSPSHAKILGEAIKFYTNLPIFLYLKKQKDLEIKSRHLGLVTAEQGLWTDKNIKKLITWIGDGITNDFKDLIKNNAKPIKNTIPIIGKTPKTRIGVARDSAFCFYYKKNLELLESAGAEIVYFSPLTDRKLPNDIKGIYIGGGYPELYARDLSKNVSLIRDLIDFIENMGIVYAECGGFMYLMDNIITTEHGKQKMVGIFPFNTRLEKKLVSLGYRRIVLLENSPLGPKGLEARGHEFHYSSANGIDHYPYKVYMSLTRDGNEKKSFGVRYKNCIASYIHLHFASNPLVARYFVRSCKPS